MRNFTDMITVFFRPKQVYERAAKRSYFSAILPVIVMCLAYAAVFYVSYKKGKASFYPLFVKIPPEKYYFYQMLFFTPLVMAAWAAAAVVMRSTAKLLGGKGRMENIIKASAYSIFAPWYLHFPFDAAFVSANVHHVVLALTIALTVIYTVILIRQEEKTGWKQTLVIAGATLAVAGGINFTFVR